MKKRIPMWVLILFLVFLGPAYGQDSKGGVTRLVFSGTIDLEAEGDEVRETVDALGRLRRHHFKVFPVADLTTDDPPAVTLYHRRRTDFSQPPAFVPNPINESEFVIHNDLFLTQSAINSANLLTFDEGRILLRYRLERFDPDGTLSFVGYGLDGPEGTGDFRLVVIR